MLRSFAELFRHLGEVWTRVGVNQKIAIVLAGVLLASALFFWSEYAGTPDYALLADGLSLKEAGEIVAVLNEKDVPVKFSDNGSAILVPAGKVQQLKVELSKTHGLLHSSYDFNNLFENPSVLGLDRDTQRQKIIRATEGEIEKILSSMSQIEWARVMLAVPEKSWSLDKMPTTASVTIKPRGNRHLSPVAVNGIAHSVGASVEGLDPENVTITDNLGRKLWPSASSSGLASELDKKRELEENVRRALAVLGPGRVIVALNVEMDHTTLNETKRLYAAKQYTKLEKESKTTATEKPTGGEANVIPGGAGGAGGGAVVSTTKETTTEYYPLDHIGDSTTVKPGGEVTRITGTVFVEAGTWKTDEQAKKRTYLPASEDDLTKYTTAVQTAISYDEKRGDQVTVLDKPFWQPTPTAVPEVTIVGQLQKELMPIAIKHGPIALLLIVFAFFARRALKKMETVELPMPTGTTVGNAAAMLTHAGHHAGAAAPRAHQEVSETAPQINQEKAVQTLKSWMNE